MDSTGLQNLHGRVLSVGEQSRHKGVALFTTFCLSYCVDDTIFVLVKLHHEKGKLNFLQKFATLPTSPDDNKSNVPMPSIDNTVARFKSVKAWLDGVPMHSVPALVDNALKQLVARPIIGPKCFSGTLNRVESSRTTS